MPLRYAFIFICLLCLIACRKKDNKPVQVNTPVITPSDTAIRYTGIGEMIVFDHRFDTFGPQYAPDAFDTFNLRFVSDSFAEVNGKLLTLDSIDSNYRIYTKYEGNDYGGRYNYSLTCDKKKTPLKYYNKNKDRWGTQWYTIYPDKYLPNRLTSDYISSIQGARALTGTCIVPYHAYDSANSTYVLRDTLYSLNQSIEFIRVNDSTISFHGNPLNFWDTVMHYKYIDHVAKTVTFETYHKYQYSESTLTYNYITNKVTFEQRELNQPFDKFVKLVQ